MSLWGRRRRRPYTTDGIQRVPCIRCGQPSYHQWQICSDGNVFRPVCRECDVALNRVVLEFMGHPDVEGAIEAYRRRMW